jgi:subtilisin-like proprotein convertase family protein
MLLAAALVLELSRESLTGTHCRYREYEDGLPTDNYVTTSSCGAVGFSPPNGGLKPAAPQERRWIAGRLARRVIREDGPLHPFAYDYDAETGELLRRTPLFFRATKPARVFDPNPVVALNNPTLQDRNDAADAVPDSAYKTVQLQDVADSGPLRGPYVAVVDKEPPAIPPPDGSGSLVFNRADDGFEDVSAYFHIDTTQRYLQSLGYSGRRAIAPYAIEADAHAQNGFDNSLYLPNPFKPGTGTLYYGIGGTDDGEDADIVVHEYGHALLDWIAPSTFTGTFSSQARAFSEAFGDYWAFSNHYAQRVQSGRDPFCFADWDTKCWLDNAAEMCAYPAGSDCLRRLDSAKTMADYELIEANGVEHRNGQIMSSAMRELFLALGKPVADTIVIESAFGAPSLPSYSVMGQRMIDADRLLYGGTHATAICASMVSRGVLRADQCAITPRGEWTQFPSGERGIAIPEAQPSGITSRVTITDTRAIEKLFVRVDITHSARGDLRIELIAPDGTTAVLQQISPDLARDIHVTYGVDATSAESLDVFRGKSAAGTWTLRVADLRLRDTGTLQSWDLVIQFAGDAPAAQRPRGSRAQMIPAIGHRFGANDTSWMSDLRIANVSTSQQTATLIFTRDGEDGRTSFSAVNVVLAPRETAAYDDVLQRVFHTSGTGSLEVLGDVIAMSRTYVPLTTGGTVGQSVPPNLETTAMGEAPLLITPFPIAHRTRLGFIETAGVAGTVQFAFSLELVNIDIPAYGHVQIPSNLFQNYNFRVITPGTRAAAYMSQIDNTTGDAIFIPATRAVPMSRTLVAPVVDTSWRSDLHITSSQTFTTLDVAFIDALRGDIVARGFTPNTYVEGVLRQRYSRPDTFGMLAAEIPPFVVANTRIVHGGTSQFVPFVDPNGPAEQHLLFIENTDAYRTNIGFVANEAANAEVTVYDSAGNAIDRRSLDTPRGLAQIAVTQRVVNGRAVVRFLSGRGRAYASMIDNITGDAAPIPGQ